MKDSLLRDLLQSPQTVISMRELLLLWGKDDTELIKSRVHYYLKQGYLYHLRRGLYAKSKEYNRLEVAARLMTPSYISFETVLLREGIIFQYYEGVYSALYQARSIVCDSFSYTYRRLKGTILSNTLGVELHAQYSIATAERAFLDMVYLYKDYYFDNLGALDWDKVHRLLPVYANRSMEHRVRGHYKEYKAREES